MSKSITEIEEQDARLGQEIEILKARARILRRSLQDVEGSISKLRKARLEALRKAVGK